MISSQESRCSKRYGKGFTLIEILVVLLVLAVMMILTLQVFRNILETSNMAGCASNLRSLHALMHMYATDNNDCFPAGYTASGEPSLWTGRLANYQQDLKLAISTKSGITFCPSTDIHGKGVFKRDATTWRTDYNVNRFVCSGVEAENRRSAISDIAIFLFDGVGATSGSKTTAKESKRHKEQLNILFVGGHIQSTVSFDGYESLWNP